MTVRVRQGWSGEVKPGVWGKFDVEVEEEDLRRILMTHPLYDDRVPVRTIHAYGLLEAEAEMLVTHKLASRYGINPQGAKESLERLKLARATLLDKVYGPADDEDTGSTPGSTTGGTEDPGGHA